MRLAWLTDIHLNFVDGIQRRRFLEPAGDQSDAVAVSGDIGESHDVAEYLLEMDEFVGKPVYFVLGNHDFYRGSIAETRLRVAQVAKESRHLKYLTADSVIELTSKTAIIGHDGWADGRLGNYENTEVILNDHLMIAEISRWCDDLRVDKNGLSETLFALADEAARHFERLLEEATSNYEHVVAVTHVPPYKEAARHQGKTSGDDFLPYFACKAVGDVLTRIMQAHPQSTLTVLCGHTHGGGELRVLENLHVLTGEAQYGRPEIRRVLDVK